MYCTFTFILYLQIHKKKMITFDNEKKDNHWQPLVPHLNRTCQNNDLNRTWENIPSDMCAQRRLKSAFASAQSDQILRCTHEKNFASLTSQNAPSKDSDRIVRIHKALQGADVRRYVFWRWGLFLVRNKNLTFAISVPVLGRNKKASSNSCLIAICGHLLYNLFIIFIQHRYIVNTIFALDSSHSVIKFF